MWNVLKTIFFAIPRGLSVTLKYFFKGPVTLQYPNKKNPMHPRYRGLHYLRRHPDGKERCVCCGLCAAICPSGCIYMEPAENEKGERYAKVYEVNELRCIFCGYCEEACPEGAVFLGIKYELATDKREKLILSKEDLLVSIPKRK
ncbi:MAG: NADH-quinone oxidoreductase subunit NuoI [candidate division Zixibacteria bacterium]|nr:NADH-quinone oxidoreductase subunit NuoI [candidate division Zixibacteria bacterium]